jgi:outer membrane protein assembly factor BamB
MRIHVPAEERLMRAVPVVSAVLLMAMLSPRSAAAGDWSRFRGPNGTGVSDARGLPVEFGPEKNQLWETEVPFGRSSPVIAGDRIFVTATDEGKFVTLALDRATGKVLWRQSVDPVRHEEHHDSTDSATTTPVTDGRNVYAFFQEFGIVSYDGSGKKRWTHPMGPFKNFYSIAASPVLHGNLLYMLCDQIEGSFLLALDKNTGEQVWRVERVGRLESYTTPVLYPEENPTALVVFGSAWLDAYELKTGKFLWAIGEVGVGPVSSPVIAGDTIYVVTPDHAENGWPPFEPIAEQYDADKDGKLTKEEVAEAWLIQHFGWLDRDMNGTITKADWDTLAKEVNTGHHGAYAIRLAEGGNPDRRWNYRKNPSEIATPLVHDGVFYMVEKGILTALDAATGELLKRDRLGEGSPKVYASPVAADGKLFLGTLEGSLVVVRAAGRDWRTLSSVDLGDEIWATPAIVDDKLYVRTRSKLYGFGSPRE